MYEVFEHTADIGLRVRANELGHLFEEAGRALFSVIVVNSDAIRPIDALDFRLEAPTLEDLLHDWLAELLYTFHVEHMVFCDFAVDIQPGRLQATARGQPIADHHQLDIEIKAITYHDLKVEQVGAQWLAEVIVDL